MSETKIEILQATFLLMMQYGPKSVSMDDIAKHMGMSKKTIYQHYSNKKELVSAMVKTTIDKDEEDIQVIIEESKDALDEIVNIARHVKQFLRGMGPSVTYDMQKYYPKQWQLVDQHHDGFIFSVIKNNIERGQAEGYYREDVNAEVIAKLYVGMSHLITDEVKFPLKEQSRSDLFKEFITYHIRGIVSSKGKRSLDKQEIK